MSVAHLEGNERRTRLVAALTAGAMVAEIVVGTWSGSLALLADGWHMATHAGALGLAALAYWYARRHAASDRYVFGTGKVLSLSAFASALFLILVAVGMIVEAAERLIAPHAVAYEEALAVAWIGLAVNILSVAILGVHSHDHGPGHGHGHGHHHGHGHGHHHGHGHGHHHGHGHGHHGHGHHGHEHHGHEHHGHEHDGHEHHGHEHHGHHPAGGDSAATAGSVRVVAVAGRGAGWSVRSRAGAGAAAPVRPAAVAGPGADVSAPRRVPSATDVNLRGAYLHVVADAMTSVLAIVALLAGQRLGLVALDPLIAVLGAVVILKWAWGLVSESGAVLLDRNRAQGHADLVAAVARAGGPSATLRLWDTGAGELAALVEVDATGTQVPAQVGAALRAAGFEGPVSYVLRGVDVSPGAKTVRGP